MPKRQVFFSFHYANDNWRASQVRNMGKVSDESTFSDNDWEEVRKKSDSAIEKWIDTELQMRSCVVVLIGEDTSKRKWVKYEIKEGWNCNKGVLGIYVHNLKDRDGVQSMQGNNPFDSFSIGDVKLSQICKAYNPPFSDSKRVYNYIQENIADWIEEAIKIRNSYR